MHSSFISHEGGRYFWISLAFVIISIVIYGWHDPGAEANGGTWYGYTLGTIGALLILWLLYLGRRKRNFIHGMGTVRGWVSAHVYFGTSLLIIGTLHTGFQFGWNIHTLAYVLMCIVILSGFFGVWAYLNFPKQRNELKKSQTLDDIFIELEEVDQGLKASLPKLPEDVASAISSAIERTEIGGGLIDQLFAIDNSKAMLDGVVSSNKNQQPIVDWLVARLSKITDESAQAVANVVREYGARQKLLKTIRSDIRMNSVQEIWLYLHIPISFGLIAALTAHIVSVFIYW